MKPRASRRSRPWLWPSLFLLTALASGIAVLSVNRTRRLAIPLEERSRRELMFKEGRWLEPDGVTRFSGIVFETYDGEKMKSRSTVLNGLLHGLSQGWWTNGVLQVTETFSNGVSHGVRTKFHPDGRKLSEVSIANGKLEGLFQRWHENGTLAEQVVLTHGVPDGESLAYHPDGSLKARVRLAQGKVIEQTFWSPGEAP